MTTTNPDAPVTHATTGPPEETRPVGSARSDRLSALVQQHGALAVLLLVSLVASFSFDSFATGDNIGNMATGSAFLAIVALGMTFVITYLVGKDSFFAELGQGSTLGLANPVWITLALFVAGAVVLRRTRFGQHVYAVGGNEDAAALMGAPVARTKILVYVLSGLLAGLAGALNAAWLASGVTILGNGMELEAISAVVIGGTLLSGGLGYVSGSLVGVLLLKVIQNVINQIGSLDSSYQQVVSGAFLAMVVVAQTWL
ncbi:ABC transporter permease, partial [Streptomyces sp. MBT97]|uniref:ABC transporter permease n=1 Tax=Streptomyces sp. MBT97 TaxID=2800411 RepID=UPI00190DB642|nr:ABC transporter permease [Streptomyces sp. MBT97]